MKKILIANSNEKFSNLLKKALSPHFRVASDSVFHLKYLPEFIENEMPDILIVHDRFFEMETDEPFEREKAWLKTIEGIRRKYDDQIRVVFLCERPKGDPFLSELVARNVLDIFHHRNIDLCIMIEQLKDNPKYSKVANLVVEGSKDRYKEQIIYEDWEEQEEKENKEEAEIPVRESLDKESEHTNNNTEDTKEEKEKKNPFKFSIPKPNFPTIQLPSFPFHNKDKTKKEDPDQGKTEKTVRSRSDRHNNQKKSIFSFGKTKYKTLSIKPKLIAVGSIHPGAGSTFLIHNFTRYLSEQGISTSVLEAFNEYEALYSLFAAEKEPPEFWDSVHTLLQNGLRNTSIPKWDVEDTLVFACKDTLQGDNFDLDMVNELLFIARQAPIVFVDISHDWNDPVSKEVLRICDELWCVTEPNPLYIRAMKKHFKQIFQVSDRIGEENLIVIGNRWVSGLDEELYPSLFTKIPYLEENPKALEKGVPLYSLHPKSFSMFRTLYKRIFCE